MPRFIPFPEQCIALASFDDRSSATSFNAAFGVLYGTGMLLGELLGLRRIDVTILERMRLEVSGFRARTLPVPKGAADRLLLLLNDDRAYLEDEPIFRTNGKSMLDMSVVWELKRRSRLLGFPRPLVTTDLRMAFATHMADRQTPFEIIAQMMGYKNVNQLHAFITRAAS